MLNIILKVGHSFEVATVNTEERKVKMVMEKALMKCVSPTSAVCALYNTSQCN